MFVMVSLCIDRTSFQRVVTRDGVRVFKTISRADGWNEPSVFQLSSPCFTVNEKWNAVERDQDARYDEAVSQLRSSNALYQLTRRTLTERRVSVPRDTPGRYPAKIRENRCDIARKPVDADRVQSTMDRNRNLRCDLENDVFFGAGCIVA